MKELRLATERDTAAMSALNVAANLARSSSDKAPGAVSAETLRGLLADPPTFAFVIEDQDLVIATVTVLQAREDHGRGANIPGRGHVFAMAVNPGRWGEGLRKQLLEGVISGAETHGFEELQLWTQTTNVAARSLYEHFGWSATGDTMVSEDTGETLLHYLRT